MESSILNSIKKMLGIVDTCTDFDETIIMHINTAFTSLNQLGVGPSNGFSITNKSDNWTDFIDSDNLKKFEMIKTYIYLKVKVIFDPPLNSSVLETMKQTISEYEWRLNVQAETKIEEVQE